MTFEEKYDGIPEQEAFRGCVIYDDKRRIRLCECDDCTPRKRENCQVKKLWAERYGFPDYKSMLEA